MNSPRKTLLEQTGRFTTYCPNGNRIETPYRWNCEERIRAVESLTGVSVTLDDSDEFDTFLVAETAADMLRVSVCMALVEYAKVGKRDIPFKSPMKRTVVLAGTVSEGDIVAGHRVTGLGNTWEVEVADRAMASTLRGFATVHPDTPINGATLTVQYAYTEPVA